MMNKLLSYLTNNDQRVANLASIFNSFVAIPATILGVWFTVYSIIQTGETVDKQLEEQKKVTSMNSVSDYLNFLTNLIIDGKLKVIDKEEERTEEQRELEIAIINRTQLLIDNIEFPEITSQVIEFLGNNNLGFLFEGEDIKIKLVNLNLESVVFFKNVIDNPFIECSRFNKANISNSIWKGSQILYSNFESSTLTQSDFSCTTKSCSNITWTNFQNSDITYTSFEKASIIYSDLREIRFNSKNLTRKEEVNAIAGVLKEAKSLYGSTVDEDVRRILIEQGHESLFSVEPLIPKQIKNEMDINFFKENKERTKNSIEQNGWLEEFKKETEERCQIELFEVDN